MRLEGHFFDIGHSIKAHQIVLGSLSEAFVPALPSIHGPILERLIEFAYNGHFYVERTYIEAILGIACQYDINPLKKFIADHLITNLTLDNAIDTFNLALNNLCQKHVLTIKDFILHNFHALQKSKDFEDLSFESLEDMVQQDRLALNEEELFDSIVAWTNKEPKHQHLLKHVRYHLMEKSFYDNTVKTCPLVLQDSKMLKLVKNSKKIKRSPKSMAPPSTKSGSRIGIVHQWPI